MDKKYINGYSGFKYFRRIKYPILSAKKKLKYLIKDQKKIDLYEIEESELSCQEVKKEAKLRIEGWQKEFGLKNMISPKTTEHLADMFKNTIKLVAEMIDFCLDNGFQPVLVVPPVSGVLNSMISKEFMDAALYKNIRQANKQNVPVLDYLNDERFQDYKLYINADFLNKEGRRLLTKTVLDDLRRKKSLKIHV